MIAASRLQQSQPVTAQHEITVLYTAQVYTVSYRTVHYSGILYTTENTQSGNCWFLVYISIMMEKSGLRKFNISHKIKFSGRWQLQSMLP